MAAGRRSALPQHHRPRAGPCADGSKRRARSESETLCSRATGGVSHVTTRHCPHWQPYTRASRTLPDLARSGFSASPSHPRARLQLRSHTFPCLLVSCSVSAELCFSRWQSFSPEKAGRLLG
jgi:hypothetical protein